MRLTDRSSMRRACGANTALAHSAIALLLAQRSLEVMNTLKERERTAIQIGSLASYASGAENDGKRRHIGHSGFAAKQRDLANVQEAHPLQSHTSRAYPTGPPLRRCQPLAAILHRVAGKVRLWQPDAVTNNFPVRVPVMEAEMEVFEAWPGDPFDEPFGQCR